MSNLTLVQKFDAVLFSLYELSGQRPTFNRIMAFLREKNKKVHRGEIWDIFIKMRREGLLHPEVGAIHLNRMEILNLITFEGKMMYEKKGLRGKLKRENNYKMWLTSASILTLVIAGLSFYFSLRSVNDSTLSKVNETLKKGQLQEERILTIERQWRDSMMTVQLEISKKNVNIVSKK